MTDGTLRPDPERSGDPLAPAPSPTLEGPWIASAPEVPDDVQTDDDHWGVPEPVAAPGAPSWPDPGQLEPGVVNEPAPVVPVDAWAAPAVQLPPSSTEPTLDRGESARVAPADPWTPPDVAPAAPQEAVAPTASLAVPPAALMPDPGPALDPDPAPVPDEGTREWIEGLEGYAPWPAAEAPSGPTWAETASARARLGIGEAVDEDPRTRIRQRAVDGRLARVHLRGGLLTLARASLEQMAGVGALDREALADLAEARWRSGDLEGAAEAATAHLDAGGDEPLAHLIVAEEADRQGSLVEARRHAAVVRERVGVGLDRLFAGEVRSTAWPMEGVDWMDDGATGPGRWGLLSGGHEVAHPEPRSWRLVPPPDAGSPVARPRVALVVAAPAASGPTTLEQLELGRAAGEELERAELELARGLVVDAVDRLSLVLRFDPALAPVILSMADRALMAPGDREVGLVALNLLRGDAYRGVGREIEAAEAYQESMRALSARTMPKESS